MPALSVVLLELRFLLSSLAQLAEHAAVNRRVVGSSPTGGAKGYQGARNGRPII